MDRKLVKEALRLYEMMRVTTVDLLDALDRTPLTSSSEPWPNIDDMRNRLRNINVQLEDLLDAMQADNN
jgi:hypothetical protein